jgi:hypothetical protein
MPMTFSTAKTPKGTEYRRVVASGAVTVNDAKALNEDIAIGGPFEKHPILGIVEAGADFSAEARQAMTSGGKKDGEGNHTAIVVTSAPLRVMLSFVVRISGGADKTRFFGAESQALAWLDDVVAMNQSGGPGGVTNGGTV